MVGAVGRTSKVVAAVGFFFTGRVGKVWRNGGRCFLFLPSVVPTGKSEKPLAH